MNILIVDDSIVFRTAVKVAVQDIQSDVNITTASNGKIAVDFVQSKPFDIIIMDLEMPEMDGTEAITTIRQFNKKIPIIIFSAVSTEGANKTLKALELGANDFVQKVQGGSNPNESIEKIKQDLNSKINALCSRSLPEMNSPGEVKKIEKSDFSPTINIVNYKNMNPSLILIGSSTGGPEALTKLFSKLADTVKVPILIIQHMPPIFTTQLAGMLDRTSPLSVSEAKEGDILQPGHCYIAPGDYHMTISEKDNVKKLSLNQDPKVCYVRPAVDVTFMSAAKEIRGQTLSIILTGMGEDGAEGAKHLKEKNSKIVIQDKKSCVVWGMPAAVAKRNLQDDIATLDQIAQLINIVG